MRAVTLQYKQVQPEIPCSVQADAPGPAVLHGVLWQMCALASHHGPS